MTDNLSIWNAVSQTDPDHTNYVNQRGGFTAIDAYYTVKRLTEQFGPLGTGWGWNADFSFQDGLVICMAGFWYERDGKRSDYIPILTMNKLGQGNGIDEDAGKKALTDAITKWASYLGFSADVFEGKFDDNRYVADLRKQKAEASSQKQRAGSTAAETKAKAKALEIDLIESPDLLTLQGVWKHNWPFIEKQKSAMGGEEWYDHITRVKDNRKRELEDAAAQAAIEDYNLDIEGMYGE